MYTSNSMVRLVTYSSTTGMHHDPYTSVYRPTSPLSPRMSTGHVSPPPQPGRSRASHSKQSLRSFRLDLPSHPGFSSRGPAVSPPSGVTSPAINLNRGTQPTPMESPRLMREKQKELIARAQLSSKLAASPMSSKPDAPRLDPLGSPKGPVTPLTLEGQESLDYFSVAGAGKFSPASSPSSRASRGSPSSGKEEKLKSKSKIIS